LQPKFPKILHLLWLVMIIIKFSSIICIYLFWFWNYIYCLGLLVNLPWVFRLSFLDLWDIFMY